MQDQILNFEKFFIPGDCSKTKCMAGYKLGDSNQCVPCPEDYYCIEEEKNIFVNNAFKCPVNCTTQKKTKVFTSLGCNYPSFDVGNYLMLNVDYVAIVAQSLILNQVIQTPQNKRCFNVDKIFYELLEFGILEKCTVIQTYVDTMIQFSCSIIISSCYESNVYTEWLLNKLNDEGVKTGLENAMKLCIFNNKKENFQTYASFVTLQKYTISQIKNLNASSLKQMNIFNLNNNPVESNLEKIQDPYTEQLHWWKNKSNALSVVAFLFIMVGLLSMGVIILIFTCCAIYYKYGFLKRITKQRV